MIGETTGSEFRIGASVKKTEGWTSSVLSLLVGCTVSLVASVSCSTTGEKEVVVGIVDTPMVEKSKLDEDRKGQAVDQSHYREMIGTLLYLTASRPDLQFAICMCARYHFIKEQVEQGVIELYFVNTEYQLADLFTKALGRERIEFLTNKLGMRSFTPETLPKLMNEDDE
nr:retrovirus-related Pol polyprotein from transposon TNT 1-94 [Tanacetum cinerariifolium]